MRGTIFAPYGRDADVSGAVYALSLENRGAADVDRRRDARRARSAIDSCACARRAPFEDASRVSARRVGRRAARGVVAARARARRASSPTATRRRRDRRRRSYSLAAHDRDRARAAASRSRSISPSVRSATAPRRRPACCAAAAGASCCRRRATRCRASSRAPGNEAVDRLINRNLLFAYFYGVGRALDDAQYYLVRTRAPWNGHGVTVRDWEALMWTLPAVQLADPPLARELLLRMCELHGYAPGRGVHYLDGTLFEPGFALEGVAAIRSRPTATSATPATIAIVDEPALADTLYLARRRSRRAARQARSAVLDRSEPVGRAGAASVHAARERGRRAGARRPAAHARRGDRARTRRIPTRCAPRSVATSSSSATGQGRRSRRRSISPASTSVADDPGGVGALAAAVRGGAAPGLDVSSHREGDRRRRRSRSRSSARG